MYKTHRIQTAKAVNLNSILLLSAWGFSMVFASFLFLWVGHLLDKMLGTAPNFMLGLFFLGLFICVMRLYAEAKEKMKDL